MHELIQSFFLDEEIQARLAARPDAPETGRVLALAAALREFGIEQSRVHVTDFDIFRHEGVSALIEAFRQAQPFDEIPLAAITVVQRISAEDVAAQLHELARQLETHADAMEHFAQRCNIEIRLHVYAPGLDAEATLAVADFAHGDSLDYLGFFFDPAPLSPGHAAELRAQLALLCAHPTFRHPKLRLANFPYCFLPAEHFPVAYRDAIEPLKGHIGSQREMLRDLDQRSFPFQAPCDRCRCRSACHAFTDIGEHPEYAPLLEPRPGSVLVFAGGSIEPGEVVGGEDQVWSGPAEQGDFLAAVLDGFTHILLIDGFFHSRFPCTTAEVMIALERGVAVFGASSMGALRAVELEAFGMTGTGWVRAWLKQKPIKPYHVVAQTYGENHRPITLPLIQLQFLLEQAWSEGILSEPEFDSARELLDRIHFSRLTIDSFRRELSAEHGELQVTLESLWHHKQEAHWDIKRQDARRLLESLPVLLDDPPRAWRRMREEKIRALFSRYDGEPDLALPDDWRPAGGTDAAATHRDRRAVPAGLTCERAERFFDQLDVTVADLSRYDHSDGKVISTIFPTFYFLDYYPISATGNGDRIEDALASAYMELVERAPASGMHLREKARTEWVDEAFPAEQLPQFYNWGTRPEVLDYTRDHHGWVRVSDLVTGEAVIIPKSAVMFAYSGTDGYASGNTIEEAVLYALYELVERDACRLHLECDTFRNRLAERLVHPNVLDASSRSLIEQAQARDCRMLVFHLPTLYGLPCVMVEFYDRSQGLRMHGGIAVRHDFQDAARAALHEAWMQYITYYAGSRDDYRPFAPMKSARIAYRNAAAMYFDEPGSDTVPAPAETFAAIGDELDALLNRLTGADIEHILVADTSPRPEYELHSVKVIVPRMELWFCPKYQASPWFDERAQRLLESS